MSKNAFDLDLNVKTVSAEHQQNLVSPNVLPTQHTYCSCASIDSFSLIQPNYPC